MNKNSVWNKAAVEAVASSLAKNHIVSMNDLLFIKPDDESFDLAHCYFNGLVEKTSGACVARLYTQALEEVKVTSPDGFVATLLDMANPKGKDFYAIIIHQEAFKPEHANKLLYLIAHELGHVHHDHHLGPALSTQCCIEDPDEFLADSFAADLLGTTTHAQETFKMMIDKINDLLPSITEQEDINILTTLKAHCQSRLEFNSNYLLKSVKE